MNSLLHIAGQFDPCPAQISPLGNGLINDTYLVTTAASAFVLQRINDQVFPNPTLIMENLQALHRHIKQKQKNEAVLLQIPDVLQTQRGELSFQDDQGGYWRAISYIAGSHSLEKLSSLKQASQVGFALGHFHRLVSTLEPDLLHDTLPGFHITPEYLAEYRRVLNTHRLQLASPEFRYCENFIGKFAPIVANLETAKVRGILPLRVIHGDPKVNNFLFDRQAQTIISLIDLDTVKPGLAHYDIGDCIRSCCHDTKDDTFDLALCSAILQSYLAETRSFFTATDYNYLYQAIELIPFELGLRFFIDHLLGNRYFKVNEPEQNVQRASAQFRLCDAIMSQRKELEALIDHFKDQAFT
jgi:Ser/Thr protein kinase RdoA (MazF antagonist)